jgi:hypothetical protein
MIYPRIKSALKKKHDGSLKKERKKWMLRG